MIISPVKIYLTNLLCKTKQCMSLIITDVVKILQSTRSLYVHKYAESWHTKMALIFNLCRNGFNVSLHDDQSTTHKIC